MQHFDDDFDVDLFLCVICGAIVQAVLFGFGTTLVLSIPPLADHAAYLLTVVLALSLLFSPLFGSWIALRLRYRNWGREAWLRGDIVSGKSGR
jgi:hypothetical protein